MICPTGKAKYFCERDSTRPKPVDEVICPSGKSNSPSGKSQVEPFAKPILVVHMMGIASAFAR
jgi:hypothetical protein